MATLPIEELPPVTVEEYLLTSYEPDCDYVDGRIEERNVGEHDHGFLQILLGTLFTNNRKLWGVHTVTVVRTQVSPKRFRVPDISVMRADAPRGPILRTPPLIAIEILSPEDRLNRLQVKADDYLAFGIAHIWMIDPENRIAYTADRFGFHSVQDGELTVPGTAIRVVLGELFAELDRQ
jgi:Uma2 family endonuclease